VQQTTGQGLAAWQDTTPPPLLPVSECLAILIDAPPAWLTPRVERRFDLMLAHGALDEVRANLRGWDARRPSSRAIGAPELVAHLNGTMTLAQARDAAIIATRQYAKRQRTWFRKRMAGWQVLFASDATTGD
jgi:tRNA dimethylallyltransferase